MIATAETISQRMQSKAPGVYHGWLKETIGKLTIKHRDVLDASDLTRGARHVELRQPVQSRHAPACRTATG